MINIGEKVLAKDIASDRVFWSLVENGEIEIPFTIPDGTDGIDTRIPGYLFMAYRVRDEGNVVLNWRHRDRRGMGTTTVDGDTELLITEPREAIKVFVIESTDDNLPSMTCENLIQLQDGLESFLGESGEWEDYNNGTILTIRIDTMSRRELARQGEWEPS